MKLTVYHDGQFWVGVIEQVMKSKLSVYRYVFGTEPSDPEVFHFVKYRLLPLMAQSRHDGIEIVQKREKKLNPKRLQREVAKTLKQKGISTKAQEAIRLQFESAKKERKTFSKMQRELLKEKKREIKIQKAKAKHRGR
ncbi:hypothetical protein DNHGIG_08700 [Collibacillus ludicampi]|uniref:DUF2992 family protein n=1 Tax=Collibacillus ludicampi TaxID=2771369 RepID=A0AAV4LBZ3_9BACL|nr:YjdF family protein [Collibacillus ludicampi]GIM45321.1 hypothetical protein DNHGIG_08700 [Collibacillus ludicampi]